MIVAASTTLVLSAFLSYAISATTFLNKIAKSLMVITLFLAIMLLASNLGHLAAEQLVVDVAIGLSVASMLMVGTLINTAGNLWLIISRLMCFTMSAMYVFNALIMHGVVKLT